MLRRVWRPGSYETPWKSKGYLSPGEFEAMHVRLRGLRGALKWEKTDERDGGVTPVALPCPVIPRKTTVGRSY